MKSLIKSILYKLGLSKLLDYFLYTKSFILNFSNNQLFKKSNPNFSLPPNYFLYETFQLNYEKYYQQGLLSAQEMIDWSKPYLATTNPTILEWGCGVARTCRHIHKYTSPETKVFACDINEQMIDWCKKNITKVKFDTITTITPTNYATNFFSLIYGISIFTHIPANEQEGWLKEMARILQQGGVFIFSTHGKKYFSKLTTTEQQILQQQGSYTKSYSQKGHRLMSTYNNQENFKQIVLKYFSIIQVFDGASHLEKLGGQDLWIVKK